MPSTPIVYKSIKTNKALEYIQDSIITGNDITLLGFSVASNPGAFDPSRTLADINPTWYPQSGSYALFDTAQGAGTSRITFTMQIPAAVTIQEVFITEFYIYASYRGEEFLFAIGQTQTDPVDFKYIPNTSYTLTMTFDLTQFEGTPTLIINQANSLLAIPPLELDEDNNLSLNFEETLSVRNNKLTIPSISNFIVSQTGTPSFSGRNVNLPAMTLYIPTGKDNNGVTTNDVASISSGTTFDIDDILGTGQYANGEYLLFYNKTNNALYLASDYSIVFGTQPNRANPGDVCYDSEKNLMYVADIVPPATEPIWTPTALCELGKIKLESNSISEVDINSPIDLVKFSDLEHLNLTAKSGSGYQLFDIVMKDHVLSYAETLGLAPLGTYVYKEAIAGTRYGYPDFYAKVAEEYQDLNNTTDTVDSVTVTINANGHKFYDIADKATFDNMFTITGEAWYYGIDTTNERIFLPRSTRFKNGTSADVGGYQAAGLPDVEGNIPGSTGSNDQSWGEDITSAYGAFSSSTFASKRSVSDGSGSSKNLLDLVFKASDSNSIYGASDTVEYASTKLIPYMVVGNTASESSVIDVVDVTTTENDTLPLFTGIYFDYAPNNVSWVIAGGQVVSGTIYTFAYNELVSELTTPKYNLNVIDVDDMVVGTDYSTYWKVDQTNQTFTCPTKLSYGMSIGETTTGNTYLNSVTLGITTDDTKSGIVATESTTAKLYFKVANAVQNLELLDAGEVLEAVNDLIPNNSSLIAGYAMPSDTYEDLTLGASGSTYTAPANGWFTLEKYATAEQYIALTNQTSGGLAIECRQVQGGEICRVFIPAKKSDVVLLSYDAGGQLNKFRFVYAQGSESEAN